jgi:hypothetical protein
MEVGMRKIFEGFDINATEQAFQEIDGGSADSEIPVLQSCTNPDFLIKIARNPKNMNKPITMFLDFLEHFDSFRQYFHPKNYNYILFLDIDTLIGYTKWLNSIQWHLCRLQTILHDETTNYLLGRRIKEFERFEKGIAKDIAEISEKLKEGGEICAIGLYMLSIARIDKFHTEEVQELRKTLKQFD